MTHTYNGWLVDHWQDERPQRLLTAIARAASCDDYDFPPGVHFLTQMTVKEVLAWQTMGRQNGILTTAVGRFGLTYGTLVELLDKGSVSRHTLFDNALQNHLAFTRLLQLGYSLWLNKKLSSTLFLQRLAMEWPLIPDPTTGRCLFGEHCSMVSDAYWLDLLDSLLGPPADTPAPTAQA